MRFQTYISFQLCAVDVGLCCVVLCYSVYVLIGQGGDRRACCMGSMRFDIVWEGMDGGEFGMGVRVIEEGL